MTSIGLVLSAIAGILVAGGGLLAWYGASRQPVKPPAPAAAKSESRVLAWWRRMPRSRRLLGVVALAAGVVVALVTGWIIAIPLLPLAVFGLPTLLVRSDEGRAIVRMEAISEWTRSLAGVLTAGQGLEGALIASLRAAPDAIRPEVSRMVGRLRARWSTQAALRAFGDELDDVTGDLVVAALILGSAKRGDGLARVLTGLAESVAEDVRARREIETDRAKPRATARQVTLISAAALGFFALTGQFLAPYATPLGQVVLGVLLAAYGGALVLMRRMSVVPRVPRFLVGSEEVTR